MKTKLFLITISCIFLSSCIKDFYGSGKGSDELILTSENYLYEGDLEKVYLIGEIEILDTKIKDADEKEKENLVIQRSELQQRLSLIPNLDAVLRGFPVPCDIPNGKCVPVRLENLIISNLFSQTKVVIRTVDGEEISTIGELSPLPGFESELQYAKLTNKNFGKQIIIQIEKIDKDGFKFDYSVIIGQ